jgi:hypothetical protein
MPIVASDIKQRLSGGAANASANASLGGAKSSNDAPSALFDNVSSAEAVAGLVEYRCVYIHNAHASLTLQSPKIWIQTNTAPSDTQIAIGLGSSAVSGTEQTVANEATAPVGGVTFSEPTNEAGGLALTDLAPGASKAVWIRRTITAGAAAVNDSYTIRVKGDTLP